MEFKVGDWVRNSRFGIVQIDRMDDGYLTKDNQYFRVCELWQPQEGEWLIYPSSYEGFSVGKFSHSEHHEDVNITLAIFTDGSSFDISYCEPFIGQLPSFIKDK